METTQTSLQNSKPFKAPGEDKTLSMAQSPDTAPALLARLATAYRQMRPIGQALAQNPNTPPEVLSSLFKDYPYEVLHNPALSLILLEDPSFLYKLSGYTISGLLQKGSFPEAYLSALAAHPDYFARMALASYPNTPRRILDALSKDKNKWVSTAAVIHNPNTSQESLCLIAGDRNSGVRKLVVQCPRYPGDYHELLQRAGAKKDLSGRAFPGYLSESELAKLVEGGPFAKDLLAAYPALPEFILLQVAQRGDELILRSLLSRKELPDSVLWEITRRLKKSPSPYVVYALNELQQRPKLPAALVEALASDTSERLRLSVAMRHELSEERLLALVQDSSLAVRAKAAKNLKLAPHALAHLAKDGHHEIRISVAKHPNTPSATIGRLLGDQHHRVRITAAKHPNAPEELLALYRLAGASANLGRVRLYTAKKRLRLREMERLERMGPFALQLLAAR